jgi:organic radical activating enzyme
MKIKQLVDTDFTNYKKPSLFVLFPTCSFKCDKEYGCKICQNSSLANQPTFDVSIEAIYQFYETNPVTEAFVFGGLEPFDSWRDLKKIVSLLRSNTSDDIVIYTGYKEDEIQNMVQYLRAYRNIIIKFGRYVPNQQKHYDEILGIELASNNQYGVKIS